MKTKKRYAASIVLREGNMMLPFKLEIKGMDFIKAGVTDEVTTKFTNMLKKYILYVDTPDLHGMMKEIKMFEREIYHDLMNGGTKYLKSQQYKPEEGYSKIKDNKGNVVGRIAAFYDSKTSSTYQKEENGQPITGDSGEISAFLSSFWSFYPFRPRPEHSFQ